MPILENVKISRVIFNERGFSSEKIKEIINEVNNAVIHVEHEAAIKATLTKGIDQVLEFAKKKRLKQANCCYRGYRARY
jgi:hypothetical protein